MRGPVYDGSRTCPWGDGFLLLRNFSHSNTGRLVQVRLNPLSGRCGAIERRTGSPLRDVFQRGSLERIASGVVRRGEERDVRSVVGDDPPHLRGVEGEVGAPLPHGHAGTGDTGRQEAVGNRRLPGAGQRDVAVGRDRHRVAGARVAGHAGHEVEVDRIAAEVQLVDGRAAAIDLTVLQLLVHRAVLDGADLRGAQLQGAKTSSLRFIIPIIS